MELIVAYLVGIVVLVGMFAVRVPHEDVRIVFALALAWPLSILAILFMLILNVAGWDLDSAQGKTIFGFRKPGNPLVKGFAVTVFFAEIQFWKKSK